MQLVVAGGVGVLHCDFAAKFDVFAHGSPKWLVVRQARRVERLQVEIDEALALGLGDVQPAMDIDQVGKAELTTEAIGAAEGLGRERRQMIDVLGAPGAEKRLQERVIEDAGVEDLLQTMDRLLATGMLQE